MSQQVAASPEISYVDHSGGGTKRLWQVFWILTIVTLIELALGFGLARHWFGDPEEHKTLILFIKGAICILSLAKAYYIVGVFMHLGSELRNLRLTIVTTLILFVWFIIAFLYEGNSWKNMRNTRAGSMPDQTEQKAVPAAKEKGSKE
jgi:hypothetical protein